MVERSCRSICVLGGEDLTQVRSNSIRRLSTQLTILDPIASHTLPHAEPMLSYRTVDFGTTRKGTSSPRLVLMSRVSRSCEVR